MSNFFWIVLALQPGEFPSIQINNFMSHCGVGVQSELMKQGWPQYPATIQAVQQCSCVLDKIRSSHSHNEYVYLKHEEQQRLSLKYAHECVGKEFVEEVDPI